MPFLGRVARGNDLVSLERGGHGGVLLLAALSPTLRLPREVGGRPHAPGIFQGARRGTGCVLAIGAPASGLGSLGDGRGHGRGVRGPGQRRRLLSGVSVHPGSGDRHRPGCPRRRLCRRLRGGQAALCSPAECGSLKPGFPPGTLTPRPPLPRPRLPGPSGAGEGRSPIVLVCTARQPPPSAGLRATVRQRLSSRGGVQVSSPRIASFFYPRRWLWRGVQ